MESTAEIQSREKVEHNNNSKDYEAIRKQVEYYLSDDNLKKDSFFHEQISQSQDGYLNLEFLQNCNKIKTLHATKDDIIQAIKQSEAVELSDNLVGIRRKNNDPLPELQSRKKFKNDNGQAVAAENTTSNEDVEPLILLIKLEDAPEAKVHWNTLREVIEKKYQVTPIYIRYNANEGHIGFDKKKVPQDTINEIIKEKLEVEDFSFSVHEGSGEQLKEFWQKHGNHFTTIIGQEKKNQQKNKKKDRFAKKNKEFTIASQIFSDLVKLRNQIKNILAKTQNDQVIEDPDHSLLKALLGYHHKSSEKLENLKNFTVGVHPDYQDTRCFFIVRENGDKEDFSIYKCIDNFAKQNNITQ